MNKEFVPYELALKLKNLGFDEPCFGKYDGKGKNIGKIWYEMPNQGQETISVGDVLAPTFSQAFRWFREEHNIDGEVYLILVAHNGIDKEQQLSDKEYSFKVIINGIPEFISIEDIYSSYEEAGLACLEKLLEIIEKK